MSSAREDSAPTKSAWRALVRIALVLLVAASPSRSFFDVRAFGARGNGLADDSGAIRQALAAAQSAGGGTIYFPPGVYLIDPSSAPFVVSSHVSIEGAGPRSIVRVRDNAGPYNYIFGQGRSRITDVAFFDFRVDQNPQGNRKSDINPYTDAENVIQLYHFDGVMVNGVDFDPEPGIQAVVLAGPHAANASVDDCTFRFRRGASSNPLYDNSSVYTEASLVRVSSNRFLSTNQQNAVTAIEVHGGPDIDVSQNEAREFQIGVNVVNSTKGYPNVEDARAAVHDNRFLDTTQGFALWSVTGRTLRDVAIARNLVTMRQHEQYRDTWLGLYFVRGAPSAGIDGSFARITVEQNSFDFRPLYRERIATLEAIGIDAAPKGALGDLTVRENEILGSPATGVRIGVESIAPQLHGLDVTANRIVDAGWDAHAHGHSRATVLMEQAWLTNVHSDGNVIVDTGRFDLRDVFSAWAHPRPNSRNVTLRYDRIIPRGIMRYSVDQRIVNDRGTKP
jgi:Pectate lyase superfamily protein